MAPAGAVADDSRENGAFAANVPTVDIQKKQIGNLMNSTLRKGDIWYVIECHWFKQWKKYVGFESWDLYSVGDPSTFPGPVDNSPLFKDGDNQVLRDHLVDELDYNLVPEEAWEKLSQWYGVLDENQAIPRKVVEHGLYVKHCKVEVYLMELKLALNSQLDKVETRQFSKGDTLSFVQGEMKKIFEIPEEEETRLWSKYSTNTYEQLSNKLEQTIQDAGLYSSQLLLLEQKNEDGSWPRQVSPSPSYSSSSTSTSFATDNIYGSSTRGDSYGSSSSSYSSLYNYGSSWLEDSGRKTSSNVPGLCGLSNIGNTCFMNSAVQCLSNTPKLTNYFQKFDYESELNFDNPLGMRGEIAKAYANLIHSVWSGKYSYITPRNFKTQVGRFAPQFSGYQQQDSQELLAFLLDGIHEDLNRIKKKPYIEIKDSDDRPDEIVASEAWSNHRKRNDSIIVDTFHGQFKSTLVCPVCDKVSVTFDPFCYLSLPLPVKKERTIEVFLVSADPSKKPMLYKLTVPKMGMVSDMLASLSKECGISKDMFIAADVYNHRFHKIFSNNEAISHILDRDEIFVYEVPQQEGNVLVHVYHREKKLRSSSGSYSSVTTLLFGLPMITSVPRKITHQELYKHMINMMSRYIDVSEENGTNANMECDEDKINKANGPDVDMKEGEDADDEELEKAYKNVSVHGDEAEPDEQDNKLHEEKSSKQTVGKLRLFNLTVVNAYGSSDLEALQDNGKALRITNNAYISLDWNTKMKEKYYNKEKSEDSEDHESVHRRATPKSSGLQLRDCIDLFTKDEKLGADDPWFCPSCRDHQQAFKKLDLWRLPDVLVVHLKRFSYNRFWRDKLDTFVDFPVRGLDMSEFLINKKHPNAIYDLVAVSNHYGGMGGGHYTAYGKNMHNGKWYYFDDASVTPANENDAVSKAAYVLFYFRRGSLDNEIESTLNGSEESEPMEEDDNDNMRSSAANGSSTD